MTLDDFLKSDAAQRKRRCVICDNPAAAADALRLKEGFESGELAMSVHFYHVKYFRPTYDIRCDNTLREHLRLCLGYEPPNRQGGGA